MSHLAAREAGRKAFSNAVVSKIRRTVDFAAASFTTYQVGRQSSHNLLKHTTLSVKSCCALALGILSPHWPVCSVGPRYQAALLWLIVVLDQ